MVTSRRLKETLSYIFQWEHWRREETQWTTMVKTPDIIEPEMKLYSNLVQGSSPYSTESHCFRWSYVTREKTTELRVLVAQSSFLESQGSNWQQAVGDLDAASLPTQPFGGDPTLHLLPLNFPTFLSLWHLSYVLPWGCDCPEDKGKMPEKWWARPGLHISNCPTLWAPPN